MKRTIALILASVMLAALLAGCACAPAQDANAALANIRLTSSDAKDAAAWLAERLGDEPKEPVVIGTDASAFGVDLSGLEDDGYMIRRVGGEIALLARTENGLDRAVRKYAKSVEAGTTVADETYHEGYRVKRIEIAGRDISEYSIYCENDANLKKGAAELSSLIGKACGAVLAVSDAEPSAPYIIMKFVHDETFNTCGYRWTVDDGGLTIECSDGYKPTSPHFAAVRFLETRLGWLGLTFGYEALSEADLISIEKGESGGETNAFKYVCPYGDQYSVADSFDHTYGDHYSGFSSTHLSAIPQCCHGMQSKRIAGELSVTGNWATDQPCYLDEEFIELSYDDLCAYIEGQQNAGKVIGEDFFFVDIAAGDNGNWCQCKQCRRMYREEGMTEAGAVVTWANGVTEALNEKYPGLAYGIFAYAGSNKPPKTVVPNEFLYITYCYDMSCDIHPLDGKDCTGDQPYVHPANERRDNPTMSEYLKGWTDITKNVYVWFYEMEMSLHSASYISRMKRDMEFFRELGVAGLFLEGEDCGFSTNKISKWIMSEMSWRTMTDDEFDEFYDAILRAAYGEDAAPLIKEYVRATETAQVQAPCANCWLNAPPVTKSGVTPTFVPKIWEAQFDTYRDMIDRATALAETRSQEWRMTKLSLSCLYTGCLASYFSAYERGDDARVAELCELYRLIYSRLRQFGVEPSSIIPISYLPFMDEYGYPDDLELLAWTAWKEFAPRLSHVEVSNRPMPDRVAAIIAEHDAK